MAASEVQPSEVQRGADAGGRRTRGGWIPAGTAAKRREARSDTGTDRGERTREEIIAAARRVFEARGYLDAGIDDIVTEAGVARGSFYTYFPAKLDVFKELARRTGAQVRDALRFHAEDQGLDPVEILGRSHRRYVDVYRRNAAMYGLIEQLSTIDPELHDIRLGARRFHVSRTAVRIAKWQKAALADPSLDPDTTAAALVSMTSNSCYWWFAGGDSYDEERAATTITDLWVRALGLQRRSRRAWLSPGTAARSVQKTS